MCAAQWIDPEHKIQVCSKLVLGSLQIVACMTGPPQAAECALFL